MIHSWLIWCARHKRDSSPVKTHRIDPSEFHGRRKKKRKRYKSIPTIPTPKTHSIHHHLHTPPNASPCFFRVLFALCENFWGRETLFWPFADGTTGDRGICPTLRKFIWNSSTFPLLGPSLRQRTEPFKTAYYMRLYYKLYSSYTKHV